MTNERLSAPRAMIGTALPARGGEMNEALLHALLELVQDVRDDRDRLLKERNAGLDGAPQVDEQQAAAAEREKAKEKLAELRSAKIVVERKLKRKTEECNRAIAEVHEWREQSDKLRDRIVTANEAVLRQEAEIERLKKQAAESSEEPDTPLVGAPLETVRRHVESAIESFDDSDKCLRALNRAQSALTAAKKTETEKED